MIFIAEIGLNHNGNMSLCYELIRQAKLAGANIVKFQLGWRGKEDEMNYMDQETLADLVKWAAWFEITLMFSIFTPQALGAVLKYDLPCFKIASRTLVDDLDLARKIVELGKETFISLGMWDDEDLPFPEAENVKYLWCKSVYPSLPWHMLELPKNFSASPFSGYSDHTVGVETALLAISRGANVIEKHFTLDKSDTTIRDHALSSTPDEFKTMVDIGCEMHKLIKLGV